MDTAFWDDRYAADDYVYGQDPNEFVAEMAMHIPEGPVLCLAEGEGRNAVYLAKFDRRVMAVDQSAMGLAKALRLAEACGVVIETVHTDLESFEIMPGAWAGVVVGGSTNATGFVSHQLIGANCYDDRYRIIYQGNNSGLTSSADPGAGTGAFHIRSGVLVCDNANALGTGNSLGILLGNNSSTQTNSYAGLLATSGNHVAGNILVRWVENSSNQRQTVSDLGLSGAGSVNYTGTIYLNNIATAAANQATSLKLTAPAGGTATFSGLMRDSNATLSNGPLCPPVFVLGEGTVKLSGNNTYNGTTSVRGGTLLLGHNNAMGAATSAVSLGDTVTAPSGGDVVAATTAELTGTYTWSAGVFTWTAGAPTALDGVSLTANARILVKDASGSPVQNGVYTRTSSTVWTRSTDLNTAAGYTAGLRVHVAGGTLNGGKNFYLQYGLLGTAVLNSTAADNTAAQFFFNPDAASNADVAILTDSALTISRNVNVTNNLSTGKSILGGNSANSSTFSGTVALSKNLSVTAASGGPVTFSGNITGSNNVTKEGLGTVKFTTAKAYTGTTSVTAGTLEVDDTLASSAVTVAGGTTLLGTGTLSGALSVSGTLSPGLVVGGNTLHAGATTLTGHLAVQVDDTLNTELISTGTINMTGGTVDVSVGGGGFTQPYYVIAQGSSITGSLPSVTTGYMLTQVGNQLRLSLLVTNSFATWIAGYSVSDSTPGGNPSHDGLTNLVKYALDLNPSVACPPPGTHTGSTLTFTKGAMAKVDSNVAYTIEESTNLVTWGAPTLGSVVYGDTITYTYPSGHAKVFARLKVIQTP